MAEDVIPDGWTPTHEQAVLDVCRAWLWTLPPGAHTAPDGVHVAAGAALDLARSAYKRGQAAGRTEDGGAS